MELTAKSTSISLPIFLRPPSVSVIVQIACEREEVSLAVVERVVRMLLPYLIRSWASSEVLTYLF